MEQNRAVLFLTDPLHGPRHFQDRGDLPVSTLIFHENERYLSQAQHALWELRNRSPWVCVAAAGAAASIGVALAAQLPVDRLALADSQIFAPMEERLPRQLARLRRFARRNLSLVVAEIVLTRVEPAEIAGFLPNLHRRRLCVLDAPGSFAGLTAPWAALNEKNLLNPPKCV